MSDCGCYTAPGLPQGSCQNEISNCLGSGSGSGSGGQFGGLLSGVGIAPKLPASVVLTSGRPAKPLNDRKRISIPRQWSKLFSVHLFEDHDNKINPCFMNKLIK